MSKYVPNIKVAVEFDGDHVTATFKPLTFSDLMTIADAIGESEAKMLAAFTALLPTYCLSLEGLKDAEGKPVTVADLEAAYFAQLVAQLATAVITASSPSNP